MTPAIAIDELLSWNEQAADFWMAHLAANPALLQLPCDIGGAASVQELVRHIWGVELRWSQRIAGLPVTDKAAMPAGPLDALFALHRQAMETLRGLLADSDFNWDQVVQLDLPWLPANSRAASRRKLAAHALLHSQRHWAQLATLLRAAGSPSGFLGDILFSSTLA
jgi:uncharacterized damage-inducible protein DinB